MNKCVIALMVAANMMASATVLAHEEPIEGEWCRNGNVVILGEFTLTPLHLTRFKRFAEDVCPASGMGDVNTKSCGQFDDEYGLARAATNNLCSSLAYDLRNVSTYGDDGTVRPIFYGPESMKNSDNNHHDVYSITQGVKFACGLCEMAPDRQGRKLQIR